MLVVLYGLRSTAVSKKLTHRDVVSQHTPSKLPSPSYVPVLPAVWLCVCGQASIMRCMEGGVDWSTVSLADGNDEKCLLWNPVRHGLPASGCTPFPHNQESWVMLLLSGQDRAALHLCSTGMLPRNVWVTHHTVRVTTNLMSDIAHYSIWEMFKSSGSQAFFKDISQQLYQINSSTSSSTTLRMSFFVCITWIQSIQVFICSTSGGRSSYFNRVSFASG